MHSDTDNRWYVCLSQSHSWTWVVIGEASAGFSHQSISVSGHSYLPVCSGSEGCCEGFQACLQKWSLCDLIFFFWFKVLGIEIRASYMLGIHSN